MFVSLLMPTSRGQSCRIRQQRHRILHVLPPFWFWRKPLTGNHRGHTRDSRVRGEETRLLLYFAHRTWPNYCFSIRWLIVCGRTNCLVLLGVADTEGLFSTFSMKWIENNAFIWRYWTWEWETCRCYRHRSSVYKVRWFWYYKGSS